MKVKVILKRVIFLTILFFIFAAFIFLARKISINETVSRYAEVKEGIFDISVTATGDLLAERSMDLKGPSIPGRGSRGGRGRGRSIRAMSLKILDIVPEGTIVNKDDYIAQLDRTNYENTLKDEVERLKTIQTSLEMKKIDTAVILTNLRNEIKNQSFTLQMAGFTLEKSEFEPPAIIRKAKMAVDKEKRSLNQLKKTYNLRVSQTLREIDNIRINVSRQTRLVEDLEEYLAGFTIKSPASGMVIYKRNWNGTKRKVGSTISPFDMVVATLPDLSSMISKTYISEIDIGKLETGQKVNIKVDAFPDKNYTGEVVSIAKIGEQLPNSDTKMFEVMSRLNEYDPELRPSMTTSNEIIIKSFDNVVYVPLECVHTDSEGISYVFTRDKTKQIVLPGESNDKYIIVEEGLDPGAEIYIVPPEKYREFRVSSKNLVTEIDQSSDEGLLR